MFGRSQRRLIPYAALLALLGALSLIACESDPLLSPQEDDKEEAGSYGRSNLRGPSLSPNPETF